MRLLRRAARAQDQWNVRIGPVHDAQVRAHLFPGDDDEHGAVLAAGITRGPRGVRLLVRDVFLAEDGVDFVPGRRGYRMLTPEFVNEKIRWCRDRGLAYLAVHNHGGMDAVAFSGDDLRSHERGYPALLDIGRGVPVGALVFAREAVAGDIWMPDRTRRDLKSYVVVGPALRVLRDRPAPAIPGGPEVYSRQALLFGHEGQARLRELRVGVIGAGGVGMLLVMLLARLGVGQLVIADPDRVETSNLPRLPYSTRLDALTLLTNPSRPRWVRAVATRLCAPKVRVAGRIVRRTPGATRAELICGDIVDREVAERFRDCDALLLAADTQQARVVFNALVHQYLIPGWQIGTKVMVDAHGQVGDVFTVTRPVRPDSGCLWCNGVINPTRLAEEALPEADRQALRYVDEVEAPSVITLNASGASETATDLLLAVTGLVTDTASDFRLNFVREHRHRLDEPRRSPACFDCGGSEASRLACGDRVELPCRARTT